MSEIKTLEMPKWGLSMEEGLLARWAIQEGDDFTRGQEICEIETSKIVNVLEAPFAGTLRRIIAREGETLQVGAVLALVADASVSDAELDEFAASLATVKPAAPGPEAAAPDVAAQAGAKPPSVVSPPSNSPEPPIGQTVIPVSLQGVTDVTQVNATPHVLVALNVTHDVAFQDHVSVIGKRFELSHCAFLSGAGTGEPARLSHSRSGGNDRSQSDCR